MLLELSLYSLSVTAISRFTFLGSLSLERERNWETGSYHWPGSDFSYFYTKTYQSKTFKMFLFHFEIWVECFLSQGDAIAKVDRDRGNFTIISHSCTFFTCQKSTKSNSSKSKLSELELHDLEYGTAKNVKLNKD